MIRESIQKASDKKIDEIIKNDWDGKARTFEYDFKGLTELGKKVDVLVTTDKQFFHIPVNIRTTLKSSVEKIIKKYNLKEIN